MTNTMKTSSTASDWRYWTVGLLLSMIALNSSSYEAIEFGFSAVLSLLFFMGLLRSE